MTRHTTQRREPTRAEKQRRDVARQLADDAYRAFEKTLPDDPLSRRWACERMARLVGTQVAVDHGEAALHSALNGAVVAGAPAYTASPKPTAAEALFRKGDQ